MKVAQALEFLKQCPLDAELLRPSSGVQREYFASSIRLTTALKKGETWTKDHGESITSEIVYGKRTQVVIIE